MREGYLPDAYFKDARSTLLQDGRHPRVVMQLFQKRDAYLGGMDEAIAILKLCCNDWDELTVHALYDGDQIEPWETVMTIEGDYTLFAHLETLYLGVLARRTLITTNVVRVLEAAGGKPIIFMPARHDHHRVQTGDGYAAYVAGQVVGAPIGVTTDEQAAWGGGTGIGTVPHGLIAAYGGDTVAAAKHFADWASEDMNVTVLVDFENDSVRTALDVAHALGPRLWGVRLDTSESLVDRSLWEEMGDFNPTGVNPRLVQKVRDALEAAGSAGVPHVASADDHELTDDEISEEPDYATTYPPHCLRGTRGAEKVVETQQFDPVPLALTEVPERWLRGREFLLLKKSFDVFTNPNADRLLERLEPDEIVVFGVATDVCDDAAIRGLIARGLPAIFVEEASRGLDDARTAACTVAWRDAGVRFATVDEAVESLQAGLVHADG